MSIHANQLAKNQPTGKLSKQPTISFDRSNRCLRLKYSKDDVKNTHGCNMCPHWPTFLGFPFSEEMITGQIFAKLTYFQCGNPWPRFSARILTSESEKGEGLKSAYNKWEAYNPADRIHCNGLHCNTPGSTGSSTGYTAMGYTHTAGSLLTNAMPIIWRLASTVHCTLYIVHCTVYNVQCTMRGNKWEAYAVPALYRPMKRLVLLYFSIVSDYRLYF